MNDAKPEDEKNMSASEFDRRHLAAIAMGFEAGEMQRAFHADAATRAITYKGEHDHVTIADKKVEDMIRRHVAAAFPGDQVLGEEGGGEDADRLWVIDPIDGTTNFARGNAIFCVSIAYVQAGRIEIGVIHAPLLGETFVARRGGGAFLNRVPIRVSAETDMRRSIFECGWSSRLPAQAHVGSIAGVFAAGAQARRSFAGALGLAYVACGRVEGYCEAHINSWDCLAGILLVEEAGGWVNDFLANQGMTKGNPIVACAPGVKGAFVKACGVKV